MLRDFLLHFKTGVKQNVNKFSSYLSRLITWTELETLRGGGRVLKRKHLNLARVSEKFFVAVTSHKLPSKDRWAGDGKS
jgi:hypothetical protein